MSIQESLDQAIQSLPGRVIDKIYITKLLPKTCTIKDDDKTYLVINHIEWIRLEHELKFLVENRTSNRLFPENTLATYWGIPVYEDELFVKNLIVRALKFKIKTKLTFLE